MGCFGVAKKLTLMELVFQIAGATILYLERALIITYNVFLVEKAIHHPAQIYNKYGGQTDSTDNIQQTEDNYNNRIILNITGSGCFCNTLE